MKSGNGFIKGKPCQDPQALLCQGRVETPHRAVTCLFIFFHCAYGDLHYKSVTGTWDLGGWFPRASLVAHVYEIWGPSGETYPCKRASRLSSLTSGLGKANVCQQESFESSHPDWSYRAQTRLRDQGAASKAGGGAVTQKLRAGAHVPSLGPATPSCTRGRWRLLIWGERSSFSHCGGSSPSQASSTLAAVAQQSDTGTAQGSLSFLTIKTSIYSLFIWKRTGWRPTDACMHRVPFV
jgi:hypothetical protein